MYEDVAFLARSYKMRLARQYPLLCNKRAGATDMPKTDLRVRIDEELEMIFSTTATQMGVRKPRLLEFSLKDFVLKHRSKLAFPPGKIIDEWDLSESKTTNNSSSVGTEDVRAFPTPDG
jgi:hypothetical protein